MRGFHTSGDARGKPGELFACVVELLVRDERESARVVRCERAEWLVGHWIASATSQSPKRMAMNAVRISANPMSSGLPP